MSINAEDQALQLLSEAANTADLAVDRLLALVQDREPGPYERELYTIAVTVTTLRRRVQDAQAAKNMTNDMSKT